MERRQGYRWRKAAGGRIPLAPRVVSGRSLSLEERLAIADLQRAGKGVRDIAAELGTAGDPAGAARAYREAARRATNTREQRFLALQAVRLNG